MILEIIHMTDYHFRYCCNLQQLGKRGAECGGEQISRSMLGKVHGNNNTWELDLLAKSRAIFYPKLSFTKIRF